MIDDTRLATLLRTALPPAPVGGPSRDLWPAIVARGAPWSWSWLDAAAAVVVVASAVKFPNWLLLFAYYL